VREYGAVLPRGHLVATSMAKSRRTLALSTVDRDFREPEGSPAVGSDKCCGHGQTPIDPRPIPRRGTLRNCRRAVGQSDRARTRGRKNRQIVALWR
jgi:hypothetical protein